VLFHLAAGATMGALLDGRGWALNAERARLICAPLLALALPLNELMGIDARGALWLWTLSSVIGLRLLERGRG